MSLSTLRGNEAKALQGLVKCKPAIPFVPTRTKMFKETSKDDDKPSNKVEHKKFTCKIDINDESEDAQTYEYKMEVGW